MDYELLQHNKRPTNWKEAKLADVATIILGQSPPSSLYNSDKKGLPFFQGKAEFSDLHPIAKVWCTEPNKIAEPNDILLSVRAPVGTTNIADVKCGIGRGLAAIRYQVPKFMFYYLKFIERELDKKGTGTTFRSISGDVVKNINVPLPPLEEQNRIVEKLDELLSELDKGKEQLQTALAQLKVYRQSLLKSAFEGQLTNENVKDGELPDGWKWVKFAHLIKGTPQNGVYKPSSDYGDGNRILRIDGFYEGRLVEDYNYKRVKLTSLEIQKYLLIQNDIVINRVNSISHLGKSALIRNVTEETVFESNIMRIQLETEIANPNYIVRFLTSKKGLSELIKNAKHAVNQASINQSDVVSVEIPLPSLSEQQRIVEILDEKLSVCDALEKTIQQNLQQAETLKQGVLKKAFEGKLLEKTS
jgi:type I restriction enzyme S subunit